MNDTLRLIENDCILKTLHHAITQHANTQTSSISASDIKTLLINIGVSDQAAKRVMLRYVKELIFVKNVYARQSSSQVELSTYYYRRLVDESLKVIRQRLIAETKVSDLHAILRGILKFFEGCDNDLISIINSKLWRAESNYTLKDSNVITVNFNKGVNP